MERTLQENIKDLQTELDVLNSHRHQVATALALLHLMHDPLAVSSEEIESLITSLKLIKQGRQLHVLPPYTQDPLKTLWIFTLTRLVLQEDYQDYLTSILKSPERTSELLRRVYDRLPIPEKGR